MLPVINLVIDSVSRNKKKMYPRVLKKSRIFMDIRVHFFFLNTKISFVSLFCCNLS